jgi:iron uptake system component EfeO
MPRYPSVPGLLAAAPLLLAAAALAGCGGSGSGTAVEVRAGDDSCEVSETELEAGDLTFAVTNDGDKVTEVYVYGGKDGVYTRVVSEVENIGPGTSRDMDVDLAAGSYEIACKPGQKGDGIRQQVTVTGEGDGESEAEEAYDREIELTVDDSGLTELDPATADSGEKIEFKLQNDTDGTRTLEVVAPDGDVAAEFDVPASEEGEAVVELAEDGDWTVKVEGGASDVERTLTVG